MKSAVLLVVVLMLAAVRSEENRQFWLTEGQKSLQNAIKLRPNVGVAKNVILFLGDGMSVATITAARILKGQMEGGTGEEYRLTMEKLPYTGLAKTYNVNQMTPDSAGTGTAYWSGVKTDYGVLGVDQSIVQGNCSNVKEAAVETLADWNFSEGKSVGIVTTARVTHASPGAGYAKIPHRDWENDFEMRETEGCEDVKDIARQLVENNHRLQVVMGGGRANFINQTRGGNRLDGRDLIQTWKDLQGKKKVKYQYVEDRDEFNAVPKDTDYLFGLFTMEHMDYDADRNLTGPSSQPSISEMVEKAIQVLSKNDKGFFLFVEGGRIDHAHHKNLAHQALLDTIAFDEAVAKGLSMTDEKDTLVLVTADHSHTFTLGGYPHRGQNIVGMMRYNGDVRKAKEPDDHMPMSILSYANGPGPQRTNLTNVNMTADTHFEYPNGVPIKTETHGGEDVAVFARGPMSHLVIGVHEQNVLAHIMGYAACVGLDKSLCHDQSVAKFCDDDVSQTVVKHDPNNAATTTANVWTNVVASFILSVSVLFLGRFG